MMDASEYICQWWLSELMMVIFCLTLVPLWCQLCVYSQQRLHWFTQKKTSGSGWLGPEGWDVRKLMVQLESDLLVLVGWTLSLRGCCLPYAAAIWRRAFICTVVLLGGSVSGSKSDGIGFIRIGFPSRSVLSYLGAAMDDTSRPLPKLRMT